MKKILLSLSLVATVLTPALAFGPGDTTSGDSSIADSNIDVQFTTSTNESNVAVLPGTATAPQINDSVGFGGANFGAQLNFTDEQLEKIAKLKNDFADNTASKKAESRSLSRQLKTMLTQENFDRSQVLSLQKKINDLHADLATSKLTMRLDTLNIMTAEQRQKIHHLALQRQALGGNGLRKGRLSKQGGKQGMQGKRHGGKRGAGACPGVPATGQSTESESNISLLPNQAPLEI